MSSENYVILFEGKVIDGHEPAAVQAQLARLLKIDSKKATELFSGKRILLKRTSDKAEALKYGKALKQVGADIKIKVTSAATESQSDSLVAEVDKTRPAKHQPEIDQANKIETEGNSSMTLAPNVGDLFDPIPTTQSANLDLSGYTILDNDGSFLVDPSETEEVDLDLSSYTVAENDGSYLYQNKKTTACEINVPDFSLAEPGSVLETIQKDKRTLSPNTEGMTLATIIQEIPRILGISAMTFGGDF